jgi:hypothetical protein
MASEVGFLISSLSVAQRDLAFASRIARHEHRAFDGLFRAWPAVGHAVTELESARPHWHGITRAVGRLL